MGPRRRRRILRLIRKLLMFPFRALVEMSVAVWDVCDQLLILIGLKNRIRRHRNRDFERAGRETPVVDGYDARAVANLEQADAVRDREIYKQVQLQNRMWRKRNKEAVEFRESMQNENLSVSQGAAINHLAEINRRAAEKEKRKETDEEKAD